MKGTVGDDVIQAVRHHGRVSPILHVVGLKSVVVVRGPRVGLVAPNLMAKEKFETREVAPTVFF